MHRAGLDGSSVSIDLDHVSKAASSQFGPDLEAVDDGQAGSVFGGQIWFEVLGLVIAKSVTMGCIHVNLDSVQSERCLMIALKTRRSTRSTVALFKEIMYATTSCELC